MSFTWSTLNKGTEITDEQMTEAKNNIDTVRSNIGLSAWTWSNVPVTQGTYITNPSITELRNALDNTDDLNVCTTNYETYDQSHCATHLTNENEAHLGAETCSALCGIFYHPNRGSVNSNINEAYLQFLGGCSGVWGYACATYQGYYLGMQWYG